MINKYTYRIYLHVPSKLKSFRKLLVNIHKVKCMTNAHDPIAPSQSQR